MNLDPTRRSESNRARPATRKHDRTRADPSRPGEPEFGDAAGAPGAHRHQVRVGPDSGPGERLVPARPLSGFDARGWVEWVGAGRLGVAAVSVLTIAFGMWWLLRAPPVPVEQTLPFAERPAGEPAGETVPPGTATEPPPPSASAPSAVVVHVAGNVARPGIYTLDAGSRVADAIDAAGGVSGDGDPDTLNLAAPLSDGARIYVPAAGEVDPASVAATPVTAPPAIGSDGGRTGGAPAGPINLNTADVDVLETLPGVGPATAAAIVDDRQRNGPFASVDDLERVRGIGPAKLAALIDLVTV